MFLFKYLSPVLVADRNLININSFNKPSSFTIPILPKKHIIATHHTLTHLSSLPIKGPIFQPITSLPSQLIISVLILIPELNRNAIITKCEKFLAQTITLLSRPLGCQELDNFLSSREERCAIAPDAVGCIGQCNFLWFSVIR